MGGYPLNILPVFSIIQSYDWFKSINCGHSGTKNIIMKISVIIGTAYVACNVPKFGLFINLVGSVVCIALGYIFPVLIYNKIFRNEISN